MAAFLIVRAQVDPAVKDSFDTWYQNEHLPQAVEAFDAMGASAWLERTGSERAYRKDFYEFRDMPDVMRPGDGLGRAQAHDRGVRPAVEWQRDAHARVVDLVQAICPKRWRRARSRAEQTDWMRQRVWCRGFPGDRVADTSTRCGRRGRARPMRCRGRQESRVSRPAMRRVPVGEARISERLIASTAEAIPVSSSRLPVRGRESWRSCAADLAASGLCMRTGSVARSWRAVLSNGHRTGNAPAREQATGMTRLATEMNPRRGSPRYLPLHARW